MMDDEGGYYGPLDLEDKKYVHPERAVNHTFNLLQFANMAEDAQFEAMDASITACEKHPNNPGLAARDIKQVMDIKYPSGWNVIVGEAFEEMAAAAEEESGYYGPPDLEEKIYVHPEKHVNYTYNLLQFANMDEDVQFDAMDASITACEKHPNNPGQAARDIKLHMDAKYSSGWNVIVGEAFGFEWNIGSSYLEMLSYMFYDTIHLH
ncbi:uncharacterized protein LOC123296029 [Chrysoperla carnea]|uniref:uncharacterized protein LOC123296029 n=1 Tax=Chrysoperla carnea TaxID=189513 RepID=UPI001D092777|nr:uncharacterized protein LOC123296029 [Chrysoperla carnea]